MARASTQEDERLEPDGTLLRILVFSQCHDVEPVGTDMEAADGELDARRHRCTARALFISATFDGSAEFLEGHRLSKNRAVMLTLAHRATEP